jgi:VCBS repeat-containing protein
VLANDSDPDGDTPSVKSVDTTATKGLVSVNPDGTIHYNPNGQFDSLQQGQTATDTFTYKASDGFHDSNSATVTVTINGVNDPPVLSNIESTPVQYDAGAPPAQITQTLTIANPHSPTLTGATVAITNGLTPSEDALNFTAGNGITGSYNPSTGVLSLTGTASLPNYQAALRSVTFSDANGTTPTAGPRTVAFEVDDGASSNNLSNVVSRTVQVNPNSPPIAGNVSASTDKHTALDINVLASSGDPDGDPVAVSSVNTTGTKGSVTINPNGTIHYDPNGQFTNLTQGQTATDTFTYEVSDGFHTSNTATVTVTINGVNDPPVLSNIETAAASYRAQDPAIPVTSTLTISDDDDSTISGATAAITSGFSSAASDRLQFTNANGITGSYNSSTGVLTLSGNASLPNYQAALRSVTFSSQDGSASPATRMVSFTVADSVGASSTTQASRNINVAEANQPPVAINHSYNAVGNTPLGVGTAPPSPSATQTGSVLNGDSDPDSGGSITLTGHSTPAHGTVSLNSDGTFTYTPNAGFSGVDTFTYTIIDQDDSNNPKSATGTVTITVGPVVWYVDNSKAAGNGTSTSPFNSLASANSAAGANSIIFLYQGNATYTGGASMKSGEDLFGQPHGLTVDGFSLVPAGGSTPAITNSGGDGIGLAENADVEGVNVSSPSGNGIAAASVNDATVGGSTPVAVSGAGGDGIHVTGGSGTLNFGGASVSGSTGHSVLVSGRTGGTATLGGTISDTGTGISLTSNTGSTTNFSGKITASTGTNPAFTATGGGTVSAAGTGSTVTTTTATALNVSSTTIGSSGLNFQSISSKGANPGINLTTTGSSGGLTVTGTGTAGSGGTIQSSAGNGITLASTSSPSFTDMVIKNNAADGINGSQVNGLTLASSTVSGNGTKANVSVENNDGLDFSPNGTGSPNGLTGTVSITNSTITGSADNNAVISDSSGTLNLTVTGSTFSNDQTNDGIHIDSNGTTNATVSVTGSTFTNSIGDHFQFSTNAVATGTNSVTFSNNTLTSTVAGVLGGGVVISPDGTSSNSLTIDNNNIQGAVAGGIGVDDTDAAGTSGSVSGTISGNTVGTPTVEGSGSSQADDIGVNADGSSTETLAITNNKLYQYENVAGIHALDREGNPTINLTITGNTIADPGQFALSGMYIQAGSTSGPPADSGKICAAISGNSMTGSAPSAASGGLADFFLWQKISTTIELPGYTGADNNDNAVVSFVAGNNTPMGGSAPSGMAQDNVAGGGHGFVGGTSCPTPS